MESKDSTAHPDSQMHFSSVQPSAHLPRLADLAHLPLPERRAALDGWIVWVNAHRPELDPERERELDAALQELESTTTSGGNTARIDAKLDDFLQAVLVRDDQSA